MTSGAYCAVQGCKNQKTMKEISFFKLPTDAKRRDDWLYMIGRPDLLKKRDLKPECHFVCHVHFEEFMMIRKPLLRPNAIPTKNIPTLPILNEAVKMPTTKEDKACQTRRKFYKDLTDCKRRGVFNDGEMRIELVGEFGPKKEKKRKMKEKLGDSERKRKKLEAEVEELKKQLEAARAKSTNASLSTAELASTSIKTCPEHLDTTPSSSVANCGIENNKDVTMVIEVDIKQEPVDD